MTGHGPVRVRARAVAAVPVGLRYVPGAVTVADADAPASDLDSWPMTPVVLHGRPSHRLACHFGIGYDLTGRRPLPAPPIPAVLAALRDHLLGALGIDPAPFVAVLVLRYPPGAGIGWHRDVPSFGAPVVGASFGGPCPLRFQRRRGAVREVHGIDLADRSAYVLDGAARWSWQHGIPAAPVERTSVTFRRLR